MAIGAGRSITMARGQRFSMNAFRDVPGRLVVAGAARLREPGKMQRRLWRRWRLDRMAVVTIAARGGVFMAFGGGNAMDAEAVTLGLRGMALGAVDGLRCDIVVGVLRGEI